MAFAILVTPVESFGLEGGLETSVTLRLLAIGRCPWVGWWVEVWGVEGLRVGIAREGKKMTGLVADVFCWILVRACCVFGESMSSLVAIE